MEVGYRSFRPIRTAQYSKSSYLPANRMRWLQKKTSQLLVHMVADVCRRDITLRRPRDMGRLLGMGRPPGRRPAAIPDTPHRKILLRRRQEATRLRPDLKRVHLP